MYIQTPSTFYTLNVSVKQCVKKKNISYLVFNKSTQVPLYKSIEVHTAANTYGIATGVNQKKIKNSSKE